MNTRDDLDSRLSAWFAADAVAEPEHLLGQVLARTARTPRRAAWRIPERWIPMAALARSFTSPATPWRAIAVVALLLLVLVAALIYAGSPRTPLTPYGPAGNGRIAYLSHGELYTADARGGDARPVLPDTRVKGIPTWSRDGTQLAFLAYPIADSFARASLITSNADGSDAVTIVSDVETLGFFSWSPDGASIAFSYWIPYEDQRDRVFIAKADGSMPPVMIGDPAMSAFNPAWSPDGKRIAFQSDLSTMTSTSNPGYALQAMNVDGSGIRQLYQSLGFAGNGFEGRTWGVEWSPNGARIVFVVNGFGAEAGTSRLYLVDVDAGAPAQPYADGAGSEYGPSWAPQGDRVAFLRREANGKRSVVAIGVESGVEQIVAQDAAGYTPQWSPDGRSLAFVEGLTTTGATVRIVRLDGTARDVVIQMPTSGQASHSSPGLDAIGWQRIAP